MHPLMRQAELMEQLVQTPEAQVNPPLLLDQGLRPPGRPLVTVQAIVSWRLVQQNVLQHLPPLRRQRLWHRPPFGREQRVKAAMQKPIAPLLQGLPADLLGAAHLRQGLAVPDRFQGQQPSPRTLLLMPVVPLLPLLPVLRHQTLQPDSAIHDTLPRGSSSEPQS